MACRRLTLESKTNNENVLARNSISQKKVAEIGCGAGEILNQLYAAMPDDVSFTGYDIAIDAINLARQREKERLKFKLENFTETNEKFDLMLMIDVFEHVIDYLGFLRLCKIKAKNTVRNSVGHLHYFTKETDLATLTDSGYEIVDYFYTSGS